MEKILGIYYVHKEFPPAKAIRLLRSIMHVSFYACTTTLLTVDMRFETDSPPFTTWFLCCPPRKSIVITYS